MFPLNSSCRTGSLGWRQCSEFTWRRRLHQWLWWTLPWWPFPSNPWRAQQDGDPDPSHTADDQRGREPSTATQRATGCLGARQTSQPMLRLLISTPLPAHHAERGLPWPGSAEHWPPLWTSASQGRHQSAWSAWQWWKHKQSGIAVSSQQPQLWWDSQVKPFPHQRLHAHRSVAPPAAVSGEPTDVSSPGEAATGQAGSLCFGWLLPGPPIWPRKPAELLRSGLWRTAVRCSVPCEDASRADARTQGHLSYHNQWELTTPDAKWSFSLEEDFRGRWCFFTCKHSPDACYER